MTCQLQRLLRSEKVVRIWGFAVVGARKVLPEASPVRDPGVGIGRTQNVRCRRCRVHATGIGPPYLSVEIKYSYIAM